MRESPREFLHSRFDLVCDLDSIRTGKLVSGNHCSGLAVDAPAGVVEHGAELHSGDVLNPHLAAGGIGQENDRAELFCSHQPSQGPDCVREVRVRRRRRTAYLSGWADGVLLIDCVDDVRYGQAKTGHPVGIEPNPHRVVAAAEKSDIAHPLDPLQCVNDVYRRVVGEKVVVVGAVGRVEGDKHEREVQRFLDRNAVLLHGSGELRNSLLHPVLGEDVRHIEVCPHLEGHLEQHGPVVGVGGLHVDHVLDAVNFLLEWSGDRGFHVGGTGAHEGRGNLDHGRHNLGVLGNRKAGHGHKSNDHHDDGDHHRHDRAVDEEPGHGSTFLCSLLLGP